MTSVHSPLSSSSSSRPAAVRDERKQDVLKQAMTLFTTTGYKHTSVEDIAAAAQISRRTLFRYFPSKASLAWGEFEQHCVQLERFLEQTTDVSNPVACVIDALIAVNTFDEHHTNYHRQRMQLLASVDELRTHSVIMYEQLRTVIVDFLVGKCGSEPLVATATAYAVVGIAEAAYRQWSMLPSSSCEDLHHLLIGAASVLQNYPDQRQHISPPLH